MESSPRDRQGSPYSLRQQSEGSAPPPSSTRGPSLSPTSCRGSHCPRAKPSVQASEPSPILVGLGCARCGMQGPRLSLPGASLGQPGVRHQEGPQETGWRLRKVPGKAGTSSGGFSPPEGAERKWRALWGGGGAVAGSRIHQKGPGGCRLGRGLEGSPDPGPGGGSRNNGWDQAKCLQT